MGGIDRIPGTGPLRATGPLDPRLVPQAPAPAPQPRSPCACAQSSMIGTPLNPALRNAARKAGTSTSPP